MTEDKIRRLPIEELNKLRELIDYRFDEYQPGYPMAVLRSSPKPQGSLLGWLETRTASA